MVKASYVVVRDAQYEAQQRTAGVALKPAVGKEMFSGVQHAEAGSFHGSFETERFIYGKIKEYIGSSHWNMNQSADLNRFSEKIGHLRAEDSILENASEQMLLRAASSTTLHLLQDERLPKALRSHVAANLLHDLGAEVRVDDKNSSSTGHSREDLVARLHLHCIARGLGWSMNMSQAISHISSTSASKLHSDGGISSERSAYYKGSSSNSLICTAAASKLHSDGRMSEDRSAMNTVSSSNLKGYGNVQSFSSNTMLQLACVVLITELAQFHADKNSSRTFSGMKGQDSSNQAKKISSVQTHSMKGIHASLHISRKEEGYGTAPIWYQQAMATGPPL
jgi:hypothetical protein